jgi:hypothetical protein
MNLRDRIGYDAGGTHLEDALAWVVGNAFHYVDFNADQAPNHLSSWSDERVRAVRETCVHHDIHLGLHTASAVNVAEFSPYVGDAVDAYLRANIDCARRLGCEWLVSRSNPAVVAVFMALLNSIPQAGANPYTTQEMCAWWHTSTAPLKRVMPS